MEIPPPAGPQQPPQGQQPQGPYGAYPDQGPAPYPGQGPGPYPPQGPAPYGYQPWGQGYSPYAAPAPFNGLAISALVLGVLCFLPLVGLVLGLVALGQIKKKGERGKGMAIAGIVLSGLGTAILALALATGGAAGFWEGFNEGARDAGGSGAVFSLEKGQCFDTEGGSLEGMAYDVDTVSCEGEHDGEVFANFPLPDGGYPGDDAVTETADDKCYSLQYAYAMDSWAVPDDVDIYYFTPTSDSWSFGDREISCVFGNMDEKGTLTGSLRQDATTLDADQVAYLEAAEVLNEAMDSAPEEEYVEDDLPGHKAWATRVSGALTEQVGLLRGHRWPADAKKPVATLVGQLESAKKEWADAAKTSDVDTFYEHYGRALDLTDAKKSVTTRKALGLESTPPPPYADAGSGEGDPEDGDSGDGGSGGGGAEV
ncbi:DUF4190 domain-containing protein [Streptomyces sp. LRE541]|uniref:DUF4190 domain-containing protein n=1 Tax=Streptomyces sp. LRE541 TaxID=2931983 RepID=UPI00200D2FDE|nr:DUF4190 domain-containing protein [Streptomyces sp. LRE541]UPZ29166.1 DUF4190 domain-containing protein [Streptomyces sp. LRE541]